MTDALLSKPCTWCGGSPDSITLIHDAETLTDPNLPIATGSEYSVADVTLSDNAQDAPIFRGDPKTL